MSNFYRVYAGNNQTIIIEAENMDIAADVYASIVRDHPFSVSCTCCGPIGDVFHSNDEEVLKAIDYEYPRIIFDNEYTEHDIFVGGTIYYHIDE